MRLILILLIGFIGFAQQTQSLKLIDSLTIKADQFFGTDERGYYYFTKDNTLYKQSTQDTLNYAQYSLGSITSVDMHNPFKIAVFYKDFNAAILLDNKLNPLSSVLQFNYETGFNNALHLSYSSENNLWLFADDYKLHLFDFQNRQDKIQTQPISFYKPDAEIKGLTSTYQEAFVWSDRYIFQFNQYGNFINEFALDIYPITKVLPLKKGLIIQSKKTVYLFKNDKVTLLKSFNHPVKQIQLNQSKLYVFDGFKVYQYLLNL